MKIDSMEIYISSLINISMFHHYRITMRHFVLFGQIKISSCHYYETSMELALFSARGWVMEVVLLTFPGVMVILMMK